MPVDPETELLAEETPALEKAGSPALRIITWVSIGVAVAAIGILWAPSCAAVTASRSVRPTTSTRTPASSRLASLVSESESPLRCFVFSMPPAGGIAAFGRSLLQ